MGFDQIIEVLAFLGATGDYSYIDRLGNSIDDVSILEAVRDALRAYYTLCVSPSRHGETKVRCPDDKLLDGLSKAVDDLANYIAGKSRVEQVKLARELSLRAYARIPNYVKEKEKAQG